MHLSHQNLRQIVEGADVRCAEAISHDHTKAMAPLGAAKLERVLRRFLRDSA